MPPPPPPTGDKARRSVVRKRYSAFKGGELPHEVAVGVELSSGRPAPPPMTPPTPADADPGGLPHGWTEQVDELSGHLYYFNELTGESTWDRPLQAACI